MIVSVSSIDDLIRNATQILSHSQTFELPIFKTNPAKKNIRGRLRAQLAPDRKTILFFGGTARRRSMELEVDTDDVDTLAEIRFMIRQLLIMDGWKTAGGTSRSV